MIAPCREWYVSGVEWFVCKNQSGKPLTTNEKKACVDLRRLGVSTLEAACRITEAREVLEGQGA